MVASLEWNKHTAVQPHQHTNSNQMLQQHFWPVHIGLCAKFCSIRNIHVKRIVCRSAGDDIAFAICPFRSAAIDFVRFNRASTEYRDKLYTLTTANISIIVRYNFFFFFFVCLSWFVRLIFICWFLWIWYIRTTLHRQLVIHWSRVYFHIKSQTVLL